MVEWEGWDVPEEREAEESSEGGAGEEESESNTNSEGEATSNDSNISDEEVTIEDIIEQEDSQDHSNSIGELICTPNRFPTKGKYIKFRRQATSTIQQDFHIPTDRFLYAQITNKLKADKFGRVYFNIKFQNDLTDGIYLALKNLTKNDFIWDTVEEEEFRRQDPINQTDGAIITPESMTPSSSPTTEPMNPEEANQNLGSIAMPTLQWDHSPERLSEDNAFFWEEEPLRALTASDILESASAEDDTEEEEEIRSPLGVFRRQGALRRKSPSMGYASQLVNNPQLHQQVQLDQVSNLGSVLLVRRPLAPELVALDDAQQLDMVLPADGTEEDNFIN